MSTTLQDLLDDPELGLRLLVDGDLNRPIRWVHVTELDDASPYLVGDEFILTAGVWKGRGTSALEFVKALETRSVAGIGYGLLETAEPVPPALVRACRQEQVPLVVVPADTPFVAISQRFVNRMADAREAELKASLRLTQDLLAAADARLASEALQSVARILHRESERGAWICDATGHLIAFSGPKSIETEASASAQFYTFGDDRTTDRQSPASNVRALKSGRRTIALIGLSGTDADLVDQARLDAAVPIVGLVLARERAVLETERRLAGELISLILARQTQTAAARLTYYGLDPNRPMLAVVCSVVDGEDALRAAERWLAELGDAGIVALRGTEVYAIVEASGVASAVAARPLAGSLVSAVSARAAGVGAIAPDLATLRKVMIQAKQACELAMRRGGGTVLPHELAGNHLLLLALQDQDVLDAFRDALVSPLEQHDARHSTDLVTTLRAFLSSGGKWQRTADDLNVHVNTLRHRLERVEELTGRKLDQTSDRVDLWLALETPTGRVS